MRPAGVEHTKTGGEFPDTYRNVGEDYYIMVVFSVNLQKFCGILFAPGNEWSVKGLVWFWPVVMLPIGHTGKYRCASLHPSDCEYFSMMVSMLAYWFKKEMEL